MDDLFADTLFPPTPAAARARIAAVRPVAYARTRNTIGGAVSGLSPYITHGLVTLPDVLAGVLEHHPLPVQHKFVFELGWREYFRHVWHYRGDAILQSLHESLLPESAYARELPADIREACTGVPVVDQAVRELYATGMLHNHARMWLASYVVHLRKVHWRAGADWLYGHLLDGDLASNHLSWQWVAGTGSRKPYLFNAENVARHAPALWHSPGSVVDTSYAELDLVACNRWPVTAPTAELGMRVEPHLLDEPPADLWCEAPNAEAVQGRDVWLLHPWALGEAPAERPADTVVIGLYVADFHRAWPWSERRWRFVERRMSELSDTRWYGPAQDIGQALQGARRVRSIAEPHLAPWLNEWADCQILPTLFPRVDRRCDSFSQWWTRATHGLEAGAELLQMQPHEVLG